MNGIIPQDRAAEYETMLSRRSFGSRVVPEAGAEERARLHGRAASYACDQPPTE